MNTTTVPQAPGVARRGRPTGQLSPNATGSGPVYELRQQRGWTVSVLAEKLNVSVSTVEKAEAAGRMFRTKAIQANFEKLLTE